MRRQRRRQRKALRRLLKIAAAACLLSLCLLPLATIFADENFVQMQQMPFPQASLVDPSDEVSDFDTRLSLTQILSDKKEASDEALTHLYTLLKEKPDDTTLNLLLAKILIHQKAYSQLQPLLSRLLQISITAPKDVLTLAYLEADLGHYVMARELFERVFNSPDVSEEMLLGYAGAMQRWGDYARAECILKSHLEKHPLDRAVRLRLAEAYAGEQRYFEAEQIYLQLLAFEPNKALLGLAGVKFLQKEDDFALAALAKIECDGALHIEGLNLRAQILLRQQDYLQAGALYRSIAERSQDTETRFQAWIQSYDAYQKGCYEDLAALALGQALQIHPQALAARYHTAVDCVDANFDDPQSYFELANLYAHDGDDHSAIALYQKALEVDPDFYPAAIALAGALPGQFRYGEARAIYEDLLDEFPDNPTLLLQIARVASWDKLYQDALCRYDFLVTTYPHNPVLKLERARVAMWAQKGALAYSYFTELLDNPVDIQLLTALQQAPPLTNTNDVLCLLSQWAEEEAVSDGYAALIDYFNLSDRLLCPETFSTTDAFLIDFWAAFRIQYNAELERDAWWASWNRNYFEALCDFKRLLAWNPSNEEFLFGYAQTLCALGECENAVCVFEEIQRIDPYHKYAAMAIDRHDILTQPALFGGYTLWSEVGRGQLSGITRHKFTAGYEYPVNCQTRVRVLDNYFMDYTFLNKRYYTANSLGLEYAQVLNAYYTVSAALTEKFGTNYPIHHRMTGRARLDVRLGDLAQCAGGWERKDEYYNTFGVQRGVQSDSAWAKLSVWATRWLYLEGTYQNSWYNDHNVQTFGELDISVQLTEYPHILKLVVQGEHRNTTYLDQFIYSGDTLVNIIHPYWTPQHYYAGRVGLSWWHDLSRFSFCGSEKEYYSFQWLVCDDTQDNLETTLVGEYHVDWCDQWSLQLNAAVYRSRQWNAEGLWSTLTYRF